MSYSEPKELIRAKQLIDEYKLDEAEQLIKSFEEKGGHTLHDIVLCHLLNCELLFWRGLHEDFVTLAEQTYKESLGLGNNLLSVDILLIMAWALLCLYQTDKSHDLIKQGEELLKTLTLELPAEYKKREASIAYLKGWIYDQIWSADQAITQFELSISLREELGVKLEIVWPLVGIAHVMIGKGEFDRALKYLEQSLALAEETGNADLIGYSVFYMANLNNSKGDLDRSIMLYEQSLTYYKNFNNKFMIVRILNHLGVCYTKKGDLTRSISIYEQCLDLFKDYNNKFIMASVFNSLALSYKMKGEFDSALECIEQSMALTHELGTFNFYNRHYLIQIFIDMGDFERARNSLRDFEQLNSKIKDKEMNSMFLLDNALILKTSARAVNRGKAEEILKQLLLMDEGIGHYIKIEVLLNLCDLLLVELQITNEAEVLEEIKPLITQLLNLSDKSNSFWILGETYLLQAKLALISLNLEEARRLLTEGEQIAEKYGLNRLAMSISEEHDKLLNKWSVWEGLKESNAPLAERMELARLTDQINHMTKKRVMEYPKLEAEQPILFAIMTKEGEMVLSSPFTADMTIDEIHFSEFLTSCNTFCDQIFSESFDRVKFGQYTILISAVEHFCIYYMFQGHSYSAKQKLSHFCEAINKDPTLMKFLETTVNENKIISINEYPSLENLIVESFLSDPQKFQMPFKAYEGDEPFVFVSYAHTDKLQVYPIIDYLNKKGIHVWYDEGIPISENWKRSIVENLERCKAFLLFITPHILDSDYVMKEISFASKRQKTFFGVYLKETELPRELEFDIADIQSMKKYLMHDSDFYPKLRDVISPALYKQDIG